MWGFSALTLLLPESDLGVVLLANTDTADSQPGQMWWRHILGWYLLDVALQNPAPTFASVADACAFPCNILPSLCAAAVQQAAEAEEKKSVAAAAVAAAAVAASSSSVHLDEYLGVFWNQAYGNASVDWLSTAAQPTLLMSIGNFPYSPTNATLSLHVYPDSGAAGASDSFLWPIGPADAAQTLSDTRVTFFRNTTTGLVDTLFLDTRDSDDSRIQILFAKIGAIGAAQPAAFMSAGGPLPDSDRACGSVTTVAAPKTLSPLALALTIGASIVAAVTIAALVSAHLMRKQTDAIRTMLAEPAAAAAAGTSSLDYRSRLLQHQA